jgi:hypothetical protein
MLEGLTGLPISCSLTPEVTSSADCPIPYALTSLPERDRFPSPRRSYAPATRPSRNHPVVTIITGAFCVFLY